MFVQFWDNKIYDIDMHVHFQGNGLRYLYVCAFLGRRKRRKNGRRHEMFPQYHMMDLGKIRLLRSQASGTGAVFISWLSYFQLGNGNSYAYLWALFFGACFLCLAQSKLMLCSANHRTGYFSNLACDWLSIVWAYSEQETENWPWAMVLISGLGAVLI